MRILPALADRDDKHACKRGSELDSDLTHWRGPIEIPKYKDALHMSLGVIPTRHVMLHGDNHQVVTQSLCFVHVLAQGLK